VCGFTTRDEAVMEVLTLIFFITLSGLWCRSVMYYDGNGHRQLGEEMKMAVKFVVQDAYCACL
jgi:hypothetical protein